MKRSILLPGLIITAGLALASCANQGAGPESSASTGPAGPGTEIETGASDVGGVGGVATGVNPGGN